MILLLTLFLHSTDALAHAGFKPDGFIVPRSTNTGIKAGPCGNIPRGNNPKVIEPGSTITVEWIETIDHPGRFEFYLSTANDANFQLLKSVPDNQNTPVVNGNNHMYSTTLTFPAGVTCTDCTLQLIQVMTENPAMPSLYYSCADIRLQAANQQPPPGNNPPPPAGNPPPAQGNSCPP